MFPDNSGGDIQNYPSEGDTLQHCAWQIVDTIVCVEGDNMGDLHPRLSGSRHNIKVKYEAVLKCAGKYL